MYSTHLSSVLEYNNTAAERLQYAFMVLVVAMCRFLTNSAPTYPFAQNELYYSNFHKRWTSLFSASGEEAQLLRHPSSQPGKNPFNSSQIIKGNTRSVSFWGHCCLSFSRKEMTKIFQLFPFYQAATTSSWATPKCQVELCFLFF